MAPKLTKHVPVTAEEPVVLENGCLFIDLKAHAVKRFPAGQLPPELPNLGGTFASAEQLAEMQRAWRLSPEEWSVTQLAKKYKVSRSFVIRNVFPEAEREKYAKEIDTMIGGMSIKQQKGWIVRHKIRQDRASAW